MSFKVEVAVDVRLQVLQISKGVVLQGRSCRRRPSSDALRKTSSLKVQAAVDVRLQVLQLSKGVILKGVVLQGRSCRRRPSSGAAEGSRVIR